MADNLKSEASASQRDKQFAELERNELHEQCAALMWAAPAEDIAVANRMQKEREETEAKEASRLRKSQGLEWSG